MADDETLVSRRPKRSTAGNRMELALAELGLEETQELEDDIDFVNDKDEDDLFESDFASTDEEAAHEEAEIGDKALQEEERHARKAVRSRLEKATAAAHARQRVTFNPESIVKPRIKKPTRRVSLGAAINAETGEVIEETIDAGGSIVTGKRQSKRRHTMMNTTATVIRMKDAEVKKAALPKKPKVVVRMPTQDELVARALDTEEGNILEHRNYLHLEEEKRARARVVRQSITGPVLRWITKKEHAKVPVPVPLAPAAPVPGMYTPQYGFLHTTGMVPGVQPTVGVAASSVPFVGYVQASPASSNSTGALASIPPTPQSTTPAPTLIPTLYAPPPPTLSAIPGVTPQPASTHPPVSIPPPPIEIDVCKNYVVHELGQSQTTKKPLWKDTMHAMFGDHVAWEDLRVYMGKNRPLSRPTRTCPLTGLTAQYLDPRTNVPFASVAGFQTLTKILAHEYVWCQSRGCYITPGNASGARLADTEHEEEDDAGRAAKKQKTGTEGE